MTPHTDVCHYCENFRVLIKDAVVESEKIRLSTEFKEHVTCAQGERDFYLGSIKKAHEQLLLTMDIIRLILPTCFKYCIMPGKLVLYISRFH